MKKILLSLAVLSFCCVNAHIPEQLDQAIKNSDLELTKKLLQEVSFSADELASLSDLSQQIVTCHTKEAKCPKPKKTYSQIALLTACGLCGAGALINTFKCGFEIAQENCKYVPISFLWGQTGIFACRFYFDLYAKSLDKSYAILKENLDNALAIRQLLLQQNPA